MAEANRKRLEAFHHTCLRKLLNVTWKDNLDKVRNVTIRDSTGQDMLEATIKKRRLRWFGHVQRMEDSRREKNKHCFGFLMRRESEVDHAPPPTETLYSLERC